MLNWEKEGPEALTTAIELNRFKKDRNDVHQPIKKMTVKNLCDLGIIGLYRGAH